MNLSIIQQMFSFFYFRNVKFVKCTFVKYTPCKKIGKKNFFTKLPALQLIIPFL